MQPRELQNFQEWYGSEEGGSILGQIFNFDDTGYLFQMYTFDLGLPMLSYIIGGLGKLSFCGFQGLLISK